MTAAHPLRAALEVVTHPATADNDAQDVVDQYSAEHQLIGSLMWLSADRARSLVNLVPNTAIWRPLTRWAYELIRRVVDRGDAPTPPAVLAAGREYPARDALDAADTLTASRHRQLALYLFDAYAQAIAPDAAAATYAREVLDEAYRRTFEACGIRIQHHAASGANRDDLNAEFALIRDDLAKLWQRGQPATPPTASRNHTAADSAS
jgi:hypothetical protein